MESMLLSVVKERKSQRKQTVFVDALLQSSLTERQVKTPKTAGKHGGSLTHLKTD